MKLITHHCPKCDRQLHKENEERIFTQVYGCSLTCIKCGLQLIAVDFSVCGLCKSYKKSMERCGPKLFTVVKYEDEV